MTTKLCKGIVLLTALVALSGCAAVALTTVNTLMPPFNGQSVHDVAYGDEPRQRLDLYCPLKPDPELPLVVFIYGGAWQFGERSQYRWAAESLANMGYYTAIPDYRLFPEVHFPEFIYDVEASIPKALRSCRDLHGCATDEVILVAHSSGAHTAAMLAMDPAYFAGQEVKIIGWVGLSGPYDFLPLRNKLEDIFPPSIPPNLTQPIYFVSPDDPPALLIHGKDDTRVYPENSQNLGQALEDAGVPVTVQFHSETRHAAILFALSGRVLKDIAVRDSIQQFLECLHHQPAARQLCIQ